jgi:glycogen debranching enzyme
MESSFAVLSRVRWNPITSLLLWSVLFCPATVFGDDSSRFSSAERTMEITRAARPWEFMDAVGTRAGLLGNESGTLEAWVYPLKLFGDFHLTFRAGGKELPASALVRTISVRPESSTLVYASDAFSVRETWIVPRDEPGALIRLDVETFTPLDIEANFRRDFNLMWPAALGATYENWSNELHAFTFGEEQKKYFGIVGSADAQETAEEFSTNYASSRTSGFRLKTIEKGKATLWIAVAASFKSQREAEQTYRRLLGNPQQLLGDTAAYYSKYLAQTVSLKLPDPQLERAYDWARISLVQGLVTNPTLGTGLIAGYRMSGEGTRPGFAWFFGRDSMWTALATTSYGDLATTRTALEFLSRVQRADGKVPHEISQSAGIVDWFNKYPYPWASADATPLFDIVLDDYVSASGDVEFARAKWDNIERAYRFLQSTMTAEGLAQNQNVGHGWIEGGPLLPVKTELYQSGLGVEATRAFAHLAEITGHTQLAKGAAAQFEKRRAALNQTFWSPEKKLYAFAINKEEKRVDTPSVISTVPMWFNLLDAQNTNTMISRLAEPEHANDWGMKIISSKDPLFDPSGYHFGSVWPLFTGWASVGEYRYHRSAAAYANLRANALLTLGGPAGRTTEVLSGSFYEALSTSSPHQIWSSAMVISPMLRGMMGLSVDAIKNTVTFAPHVPADWTTFEIDNVNVKGAKLNFLYRKTDQGIELHVMRDGAGQTTVEFSPSLSPAAVIGKAQLGNSALQYQVERHPEDQDLSTKFTVGPGTTTVRIPVANDFGVSVPTELPPLGSPSENLKVVSESWSPNHDELTMIVAGRASREYEFAIDGTARITNVEGAELTNARELRVRMPAGEGYQHQTIQIRFAGAKVESKKAAVSAR